MRSLGFPWGRVASLPSSHIPLSSFRLHPSGGSPQDPLLAEVHRLEREEALRALHALGVPLGLEIQLRSEGSVSVDLLTPRSDRQRVASTWGPRLAPWSWKETPSDARPGMAAGASIGWIGGTSPQGKERPLRSTHSPRGVSPWTLLLPAMRSPTWDVCVRWVARPVGPSAPAALTAPPRLPRGDRDTPLPIPPAHRLERELTDLKAERSTGPFWSCGGSVLASSARRGRPLSRDDLERLSSVWDALSGAPGGDRFALRWLSSERSRLDLRESARELRPPQGRLARLGWGPGPTLLAPSELLLWLPPWDARRTPGLRGQGSVGRRAVRMGYDDAGEPVLWEVADTEGHHLTVTGETGMGKSTLLERIGSEVLRGGASLVVLDPLGETAQALLARLPAGARERAVWVSPLRSPVGINALDLPTGFAGLDTRSERERRVSELVTALRRVRAERYGDTVYWGPRIEDLLTRTLLLLAACPGSTLRDAAELLSEPDAWAGPVLSSDAGGSEARALWESLRREGPEERQGALRVVQEVALSSAISRILAARTPKWSLDRALLPGAATFFDLERTAIGVRASSYLGAALLSLLWSHLLARKERGKVVLVLDEVQEFANDALTEMLRLGRRYNLHVLAATQSLASLPDALRDSLVTNSRDLVLFRGSAGDARLAHEGLGVSKEYDLVSLPQGCAIALLHKGAGLTRLQTEPRPTLPDGGLAVRSAVAECILRSRPFWSGEEDEEEAPPSEAGGRGGHGPPGPTPRAPAPDRATPPSAAAPPSSARSPTRPPGRPSAPEGPDLSRPLMTLLVASWEAPEGMPFPVRLSEVRRLVEGEDPVVRRLGACLKGAGALDRTERSEGERVWWLRREALEQLVPAPWDPVALAAARERWTALRSCQG